MPYKEVLREPVIREPNVQKNVPALVADFLFVVCGSLKLLLFSMLE